MTASEVPSVEVRSRADLRRWLSENHAVSGSVWLVTWKKATPHHVPFGEYVEELLCWGWIDSATRGLDTERSSVRISPRNPKSAWSAVNKGLIEVARASGAMTEYGEAAIARGVENGMWEFLDDVEALILPDDLQTALGTDVKVWKAGPRSLKRAWLEKIKTAKTARTREKRIRACAEAVAANDLKLGLG